MAKLPKVTKYVTNVGKSIAYASIDAIKSNSPGISDFIDTNNDVMKEMYSSVRDYKGSIKKAERHIKQSNLYKAIEIGAKNMIQDAKTGEFYKDRTEEYTDQIFDFDDGFDTDVTIESNASVAATQTSTQILSDSINSAVGAAAISQNTAIAKGTNLMIKSGAANTKLVMAQMDRISASFTSGMGAVYSGIAQTNQFLNGPMFSHLENSRKFYEEATNQLRDQSMMLKEMLEMQRNLYKQEASKPNESRLDQSTRYSGVVDLKGYFKNVKSNVKDIMDATGLSMLDMGGSGMNPFMLYAASPFAAILEPLAKRLMSKEFKKAIRSFDQGMTSFFSQMVAKMNSARDNDMGIMSMIGELFGIKLDKKKEINASNYNKGAMQFDGITRQAIIETIPGYLSRIEAALTHSSERHYDYQSGSWKSAKKIQSSYEEEYNRSIANANRGWMDELEKTLKTMNEREANNLRKSASKMANKIYEDGGDFDPTKGGEYYGMSQDQFKKIYQSITKESTEAVRNIAQDTMKAIQDFSSVIRKQEESGGVYRHLANGTYDITGSGRSGKPSDFKSNNVLTLAVDSRGKNIFYYLREILTNISNRNRSTANSNFNPKFKVKRGRTRYRFKSSSESSSNSDSDDSGPDDEDDGIYGARRRIEDEEREREEEKSKKIKVKEWIKSKLGDGPIAKALGNMLGGAADMLSKPVQYATKLLNKANDAMFSMMFGDKERKLRNGETANSVFEYMIDKIKGTFEDLSNYLKDIFGGFIENHLKPFVQPIWEKYGKPVVDELKNMGNKAKDRVKQTYHRFADPIKSDIDERRSYNDWFVNAEGGREQAREAARAARDRNRNRAEENIRNGGVSDADDFRNDIQNSQTSAFGRLVTKTGLTMISPGEIVIPASFDKKEQRKMLAREKKEKKRIIDAIGHNAEGNINTEGMRQKLRDIYDQNMGKGAKNTAAGIVGAGAGLLTGVNPLLGAMAGVGLSILSNSKSFQDAIFGKMVDGERQGGLISKKIQDIFNKSKVDMTDFGIAGGIIGLLTPFGPLGGAAIGAGIGLLKNSERFKKFVFGDAETGEDGFITRENYDKAIEKIKGAVPNMAVGAVGGALLGPFGLLGNAVIGAGIGLLSSTDAFHEFIFGHKKGEKYDKDKDGPRKGLAGAIERGIIDPAKEKIVEILESFKNYAKKNILEPMKNFFEPLTQAIKNIFRETADKIKDHLNDMFERTIGIPIHDFLQEKLFKPVTKFIFGIIKAPLNVAKAMVAAPFRALGGIGNSIRMGQIKRGTAHDMSAQERLDFRKKHKFRTRWGQITDSDEMLERDEMLASMSEEQLESLRTQAEDSLKLGGSLQRQRGEAREAVGAEISDFFNRKDENNRLRYDKMKISKVKKFAKMAADGDLEGAKAYLMKQKGLSDEEKDELIVKITKKVEAAYGANAAGEEGHEAASELDREMSRILGQRFKGNKSRRRLIEQLKREQKARSKTNESVEDDIETENSSPEAEATTDFKNIYEEKTNTIIDLFKEVNENLKASLKNITGEDYNRDSVNMHGRARRFRPTRIRDAVIPRDDQEVNEENTEEVTELSVRGAEHMAKGGKAKKKGLAMVSPGELILSVKEGINSVFGKKKIDKDSKEAVEERALEKEKIEVERKESEETSKTNTILSTIKDKLVGAKDKAKESGSNILGKLSSGFSKFWKFMGVGGKIALGVGGVSLLGHATEWFKNHVWPLIREALFGKSSEDGSSSGGLVGGFKESVKSAFYGDGSSSGGILTKAGTWIGQKLGAIKKWYDDQGGLGGILSKVLPSIMAYVVNGWGYAMTNVVTPVAAVIFKHLPSMLGSLGKAILAGLRTAIFDKTYTRPSVAVGGAKELLSDLKSALSSQNSTISSASSGDSNESVFWSSVKSAYSSSASAMGSVNTSDKSDGAKSKNPVLSSVTDDDSQELPTPGINSTSSGGIPGLLGQTKRTNVVEFDENGNPITEYSQNNRKDSVLSHAYNVAKQGFKWGLSGRGSSGLVSKIAKSKAKGVGKGRTKLFTKTASKIGKYIGKSGQAGQKAGSAVNKGIHKLNDYLEGWKVDDVTGHRYKMDKNGQKVWDMAADNTSKGFVMSDKSGNFAGINVDIPDNKTLAKEAIDGVDDNVGKNKSLFGKVADKFKSNKSSKALAKDGVDNATKKKSVISKIKPKKAASKGADLVDDAAKAASKSSGPLKAISNGFQKIFNSLADSPIVGKIVGFMSKAGSPIGEEAVRAGLKKIGVKLGEKGAKGLGKKALGKAVSSIAKFSPLQIAFMVKDFLSGYSNAYTILGVPETGEDGGYKVSVGQKIICGLLNMINNYFYGIIPTETLVDIFVDILGPILNINMEDLQAARSDENVNAVLDKWNKEHPEETYDNLEDFNKRNRWYTKAGKGLKKLGGKALEGIKKGASWVGDKAKAGVDLVKKGASAVASKVKKVAGKALDIAGFVKNYVTKAIKYATTGEEYSIDDLIEKDDPLEGVKRTLHTALKIPIGLIGGIAKIGKNIFDKIKKLISGAKEGFTDATADVKNVFKGKYTVFSKDYWKFNNEDEENPMSTLGKIFSVGYKVSYAPMAMLGYVGTKIWKGLKATFSGVKDGTKDAWQDIKNVAKGKYTIFSKDYWKFNNEDDDNELSLLAKISSSVIKVLSAPKAMLGYVGTKIWKGMKATISGVKDGSKDAWQDIKNVAKGQYTVFSKEYWKFNDTNDDNELSLLAKISSSVIKYLSAPKAMIGYVGSKLWKGIKATISGAKEGLTDASKDIENVKKGKYTIFSKEYWKSNNSDDDNELSKIGIISASIIKYLNAPQAMLGYIGTKVKDVFNKIISSAKDISEDTDKIIEKAKKDDISVFSKDYWKIDDNETNPLGLVGHVVSFIQRLAEAPIIIFTKVFNKIKEKFDSIKGWFSKLFGEDAESVDTSASGKGKQSTKGFGKSHKNYRYGMGPGPIKISQQDPSIAGIQYNGHTIGDAGCAPVAATNLINTLRGNNDLSVEEAANYATSMGFKDKNDGTKSSYMSSILKSSGISSSKISGKSNIDKNLKSGNPVVMVGKGSTESSPYGNRSPHFITAMGYDKSGKVIIDDPYESNYKTYNRSDIMNGNMESIAVDGGRGNIIGSRKQSKNYKYGFGLDGALKEKIISKTAEITASGEGSYDTVVPKDVDSWSVGMMGFHRSLIPPIFNDMAEKLSGSAKDQALKYAKWPQGKVLSSSEAAEVKKFLQDNKELAIETQIKHAKLQVGRTTKVPIEMYDSGKLKDYRSIILAADIGNTGPNHLNSWKGVYSPVTDQSKELKNVHDSLRRDSWWAKAVGNSNRNGWMNRISKTYDKIKDWSADNYNAWEWAGGSPSSGSGESSSDGNSTTQSSNPTLLQQFGNLGTSMVKAMFGKDAYEAFFGSESQSNSSGSSNSGSGTSVNADGSVESFVQAAINEEGYHEKASNSQLDDKKANSGDKNYTKYGEHFGNTGPNWPWCAQFVSWAADQAGIPKENLTRTAGTAAMAEGFKKAGRLHDKNGYTPKRGDVFFRTPGNNGHTGIVTGFIDGQVKTIEGNSSDEVKQRSYPLSSSNITYFGDLGLGAASGTSGTSGTDESTKVYGKTIYAKGKSTKPNTGIAAKALQSNGSYADTTYSKPAVNTSANGSYVDYTTFLQTIVSILMSISDNTGLLAKVLEILSTKFDLDIDKSEIQKATSQSKAQTEKALNELIQKNKNNTVGISRLLNNKDTDYIIHAMRAIATE